MGAKRFGPYHWELEHYGVRRFGELRRGLPGISEKMLIQQVRELEEDGLISRVAHPEVPPRVEYRLTDLGRSMNSALEPLGAWGSARIERIGAQRVQAGPEREAITPQALHQGAEAK